MVYLDYKFLKLRLIISPFASWTEKRKNISISLVLRENVYIIHSYNGQVKLLHKLDFADFDGGRTYFSFK